MSSQEIAVAVVRLIEAAEPYMNRLDVEAAVIDCMEAKEKMITLYNSGTYSDFDLEDAKQLCYSRFIRLEYIMSFLPEFREKYQSRCKCKNLYDRIKKVVSKRPNLCEQEDTLQLYCDIRKLQETSRTCAYEVDSLALNSLASRLDVLEVMIYNEAVT